MPTLSGTLLHQLQTDHTLMLLPQEREAWHARERQALAGRAVPACVVADEPDLVVAVLTPSLHGVVLLRFPRDTLRGLPRSVDTRLEGRLLAVHPAETTGEVPLDLYPPGEARDHGPAIAPRIAHFLSLDHDALRAAVEAQPEPTWERCLELGRQALRDGAWQPRDGRPLHVGMCGLRKSTRGPERSPFHAGQEVGDYVLVERLGRGSMGEVWRGRRGDEDFAVKLPLRPSFVRHLRREGVLLARVEHPHVARFVHADVSADIPYLVTELVQGQPLRALCRGTISSAAATLLCDQLLAGLAAIHAAGVLHLDLKPENVIVTPEGRLKIVDLGLGRATTAFMEEVYLSVSLATREPPVAGTLAYMAPEQRRGRPLDARADLFAFGILLHELLSGHLPEPGKQLTDRRTDLAPRWDVSIARLTHPDPDRRPADAAAARLLVSYTLAEKAAVPVARGGVRPRDLASFDEDAFALVSPYVAGMVVGDGYELVRPLGRGGFGEVWEARRGAEARGEGEEERVALKLVLTPEARAGLAREAEVARRLGDAPGIPRLVADRSDDEPPHVVFELVRGQSLRLLLHERGDAPLPVRQALRVFEDMARLVAVCAAADVVHMDLKPEHFLVEEGPAGPRVSLIDFGLAALLERASAEGSLATRAEVRGTLDYMAPEQREGQVSPAVDVFALGVCLFELLTLSLPRGPQRAAALRRDVPAPIDALLLQMLAREPRERPSVGQARAVVAAALELPDTPSRRVPAAAAPGIWSWRLRQAARAVLLTPWTYPLLVLVIGLGVARSALIKTRDLRQVSPQPPTLRPPSPVVIDRAALLRDPSDGSPTSSHVAPTRSASTAPSRS